MDRKKKEDIDKQLIYYFPQRFKNRSSDIQYKSAYKHYLIAKWSILKSKNEYSEQKLEQAYHMLSSAIHVNTFTGQNNDLQEFEKKIINEMIILEGEGYNPENYTVLKYFSLMEIIEQKNRNNAKNKLKNGRGKN